jgi:[protein-PII] uridylyltransferase
MQRYYRAAKLVRQVNTILLQNLHARLYPRHRARPIDEEFQRVDELLDMRDGPVRARPAAMLDAFLRCSAHPSCRA